MTHAKRMREDLFTEFQFCARHLSPLRRLYRQMCGDVLGQGIAFHAAPGLHAGMTWHYASNPRTLGAFSRCLTGSRLGGSLTVVLGEAELLSACFVVVRGATPLLDFHMDYGEPLIPQGVTGTMLTPLMEIEEVFGHLDYRMRGEDHEYRYRVGDAILFDGKFEHRPQEALSPGPEVRVLVSWSIATTDERYCFAIRRIIEAQVGVPED